MILASAEHHGVVSTTLTTFISLLAFATVVGVCAKFVKVPYTIALVLAGTHSLLVFGAAPGGVVITQELILVLLLPPLLFQAGLHLDIDLLQKKAIPVVILAIPGVCWSRWFLSRLAVRPFLRRCHMVACALVWRDACSNRSNLCFGDTQKCQSATQVANIDRGRKLVQRWYGRRTFFDFVRRGFYNKWTRQASLSVVDGVMQFVKVAGLGDCLWFGVRPHRVLDPCAGLMTTY